MARIVKADERWRLAATVTGPGEPLAKLIEADRLVAKLRRQSRDRVVELALGLARRIVRREVERDSTFIAELAVEAAQVLRDLPGVTVFAHPDDRAASGLDRLATSTELEVRDDPTLERGGVRVAAAGLVVDLSLGTVLEALRRGLGTAP